MAKTKEETVELIMNAILPIIKESNPNFPPDVIEAIDNDIRGPVRKALVNDGRITLWIK